MLNRKHGDTGQPIRLSLGRDLTGIDTVSVRIARDTGTPAVIDREAIIEDPASDGIVRLVLTTEEADDVLIPGRWLIEARPDDGTIHPDISFEDLKVHQALEPAPP